MNLVLIGFKACGKTTVGKLLAAKLARNFVDTDRLIETAYFAETKKPFTTDAIYREEGAPFFRALEKKMITELKFTEHYVIATGGGVVLDDDNVQMLKQKGTLIYLSAPAEMLKARLENLPLPAFLQNDTDSFFAHYLNRKPIYESIADYEIPISEKTADAIAQEIIAKIEVCHGE